VNNLEVAEVEALVPALNAVGRFEKELYSQFAAIIKVCDNEQHII